MSAVKQNGEALQCASEQLQNDVEVVLAAEESSIGAIV